MGLFFLSYTGIAISIFPHLPHLPLPSLSLFDAAASLASQRFLLPGLLVPVPLILAHNWFNYRGFHVQSDSDEVYGYE